MSCPVPWSQRGGDIPGEWASVCPAWGNALIGLGCGKNPALASFESMLWMRTRLGQGSIPLCHPLFLLHIWCKCWLVASGDTVAAPLGGTLGHAHGTAGAIYASCRQTWSVCQWSWASSNKNTLVACSLCNPQQRDLLESHP